MLLTREHVQRIINEKSGTPFQQRNFLNTLRAILSGRWPKAGSRKDDPTLGVTDKGFKSAGYRTWSEGESIKISKDIRLGRWHASPSNFCSRPLLVAAM